MNVGATLYSSAGTGLGTIVVLGCVGKLEGTTIETQ